jgi:2-(1,2-epoxy-1,2-dihydrophenyl)acetyl-CoA isomerase
MFLSPRLSAAEAKDIGLVTDVFPTSEFDARVLEMAERLANGPTRAFAVAKSLIHQAAGADQLDYHLDQELQHLARIADGEDYAEGMAAFFERRPPKFSGRG